MSYARRGDGERMLSGRELHKAIQDLPSRPLRDLFYRAAPLRFARDPLGRGRPIIAQRFNIAAGARVLYLADDPATCLAEVQAFGFPATAVAIIPIHVDLKAVADLREQRIRRRLRLTKVELERNFRRPPGSPPAATQQLGEACARLASVDGLLYESLACPGKGALAVIEASLAALGSSLTVDDPRSALLDRLP